MSEHEEPRKVSGLNNEAVATSILLSLSGTDRDVVCRFYLELQSASEIERDLGLQTGYVEGLKAVVKARFLAERRALPT